MLQMMALTSIFTSAWADPTAAPGVHAAHMHDPPAIVALGEGRSRSEATDGPNMTVYGYLAYWADDLDTVPWDELSHIAVFAATAETDGSLTYTSRWDDVDAVLAAAEPYGVRVHLCVLNFDDDELEALLSDEEAWRTLVDNLAEWKDTTGVHGINVDFEGVPSSVKQGMVDFTAALEDEVGEVVLATPAVDWYGAWDYSELSKHADLFIMGYGYHWSGGNPGPVDPLFSSDTWGSKSLDWSVDDYLTYDADPARVILGLPLYGYIWENTDGEVPGEASESATSITYSASRSYLSSGRYDSDADTPYWLDGRDQGWSVDAESVALRIAYAREQGIGGVGFWALNYDGEDAELWELVRAETTWDEVETNDTDTEDTDGASGSDFTAVANDSLMAYPGDTVVLDGSASTGPDGATLEYRWTQVSGPDITLADADTANPSFTVTESGVYAFDLRAGAGSAMSAPDRTWVTVPDTERGATGCTTGAGPAWLFLVGLLAFRRRR